MVHNTTKNLIRRVPVLGPAIVRWYRKRQSAALAAAPFRSSSEYWEKRYSLGMHSGDGSYGRFAAFKAEVVNTIIVSENIRSVIEFGFGDGNQLKMLQVPHYLGFEVSQTAVTNARATFEQDGTKTFRLMEDYDDEKAELTLSLDVIYHLVEDRVFDTYMFRLFGAALRFVIIYSTNT